MPENFQHLMIQTNNEYFGDFGPEKFWNRTAICFVLVDEKAAKQFN